MMEDTMERLLHKFFKGKIPKLKDMASEGIVFAQQRKAAKLAGAEPLPNATSEMWQPPDVSVGQT
jgi:hypothetical protein